VEYLLDVGAVLSTTGLTLAVAVPSGSTVNVSAGVAPAVVTAADEYEKRSARRARRSPSPRRNSPP
jgi:tetrahydromethanopterin S-methyltransferase subunit C